MSACPSCGTEVSVDARFCSSCGTKLQHDAPPPPDAPKRRTGDHARAERRQLTVMFCDIADSTKLSEQLDPEDLMEIVRRYQTMCAEVVERFGGSIAQYLGDGLLVYFGYPTAYENAPERAARAGLEILSGLDKLNRGLERSHGITLKLRLGIHTGLVVIGEVGAGAKREQLAVGDTANIAARLESLAPPNAGLISDATHLLVEGLFETESMGELELKGIATPMEVHRLLRLSAVRHRLEGTRAHSRTPFVGRETEMAALTAAWQEAEAGRGTAVLLRAEAGVGKSRMIPAFKVRLDDRPVRLHEAYCSPFYTNSALHPLAALLRVEAGIGRDDDPSTALHSLREWLDRPGTPADALPLLATLLDIPASAGFVPLALSPQARRLKTVEVLLTLLLPGPDDPPTLLVIEDVHWIDPSTLELVERLVAQLPEHRAMLLATARPSFEPPWAGAAHVRELALSPFSEADTRALVLAMTEGRRLPGKVLAQLISRTDGIPLFVEELTRMLMDAGQLEDTKSSAIPTTLHDSLMARLDRIDPVARRVAQLGATIGRAFDVELLRRIHGGDETELQRGIEALLQAQLVHRQSGSDTTYIFKHALIQDAAYESLLKRTRQSYHDRIAEVLAEGFGRFAELEPELLAHHLEAAGPSRREDAVRQWLAAGERAQASSSNKEAASHLRRGLALVPELPEGPERDRLELTLQSKLGTTLSALKGYASQEVELTYARAHELSERLGSTPEGFWVLWGLWAFYLVQGTHEKGVLFAEMMLEQAQQGQPAQPGLQDESRLLEAHFSRGLSSFFMGDDLANAREHLEWVVARYDADRHHGQALLTGQDVGVTSRSVSALVLFQMGETTLAVQRHREALELSERLDHAFSRAYALGCAAWFQLYMRDYELAARYANEAVALSQEQSFGWWLVWGSILGGSAGAGLGTPGSAAQIERCIALWRQTGSGFTVPYFLGLLSDARRREGELEAAGPLLDEAQALADRARERFFAAELHRLQGQLALDRGSAREELLEAADASFRAAIDTARAQGAAAFLLRAATARAELLRDCDREEEARQVLAEAYEPLAQQASNVDLLRARELLDALSS